MSNLIVKDTYVVVQKVGGEHIRVMRFTPKQKVLIEKLKFEAESSFGQPYGLFEVASGKVKPIDPIKALEIDNSGDIELRGEVTAPAANGAGDAGTEPAAQTAAGTEGVDPAQALQKLTQDDVIDLKNKGTSAEQLVAKLVEGNKSFGGRTTYSQSKYIRRKTKKHSDRVLILKPTIRLLTQSYYLKDAERVANLRIDQLGLLMQMANIHYGKRVVVFEQVLGVVTSSVLDRLGGAGACIHIHRGLIAQSIPCVHSMNYSDEILEPFLPVRIEAMLRKNKKDAEHNGPENNATETTENKAAEPEPMDTAAATPGAEGTETVTGGEDKDSTEARRADRLNREKKGLELMDGNAIDSLIIASRTVDPVSVLEVVYPKLRSCASVVVYCDKMQLVVDAQAWLMQHGAINVQMSSQMYRMQQVLPDRTHPLMAQHVVGGYVLSGIKTRPTTA